MKIILHKNFVKKYQKLRPSEKKNFKIHRDMFINDPYDAILNNHALKGNYSGYRSINITGNIRLIYKLLDKDITVFAEIGTHGELYE